MTAPVGALIARPGPRDRGLVHVFRNPEFAAWEESARAGNWKAGRPFRDEHGEGFRLTRTDTEEGQAHG